MAEEKRIPRIALVVPDLVSGGGVPSVALFLHRVIEDSGMLQTDLFSVPHRQGTPPAFVFCHHQVGLRSTSMNPEKICRVLIYRLGSLGDTIVALPSFHLVRETFPRAHVTLLTSVTLNSKAAPVASILEGTRLVDDYIEYSVSLRDPRRIAKLRADLATWIRLSHLPGRAERGSLDLIARCVVLPQLRDLSTDRCAVPEAGSLLSPGARDGTLPPRERTACRQSHPSRSAGPERQPVVGPPPLGRRASGGGGLSGGDGPFRPPARRQHGHEGRGQGLDGTELGTPAPRVGPPLPGLRAGRPRLAGRVSPLGPDPRRMEWAEKESVWRDGTAR